MNTRKKFSATGATVGVGESLGPQGTDRTQHLDPGTPGISLPLPSTSLHSPSLDPPSSNPWQSQRVYRGARVDFF